MLIEIEAQPNDAIKEAVTSSRILDRAEVRLPRPDFGGRVAGNRQRRSRQRGGAARLGRDGPLVTPGRSANAVSASCNSQPS